MSIKTKKSYFDYTNSSKLFLALTFVFLLSFQQVYAIPEIDDEVLVGFEHGDAKAIPNWVR
ncbi:MAG: hypothetical protein P8X83_01950, partial [Nitrosopumilaceae archaeon]